MAEDRVMVTVRLSGSVSALRDWSPWLTKNPKIWKALGRGEDVEFPEDQITAMRGSVKRVSEFAPGKPAPSKFVRVVKRDNGDIYHDGALVDGPSYREQMQRANTEGKEASSKERLAAARRATEARQKAAEEQPAEEQPAEEEPAEEQPAEEEPAEEQPAEEEPAEEEPAEEPEVSPSTDEVSRPKRPKRRKK